MERELLELVKLATEEEWDNYRVMAAIIEWQKEKDAQIAEVNGAETIADKIRKQ